MDINVTDTIQTVDEDEWDRFAGCDPVERSHAWYRTVEESGMRKMHYVFLRENEKLRAAACCFLLREKMHRIGIPFLNVQSPLGVSPAFFSETPDHARILLERLEEIRKKEKGLGIMLFCLRKEELSAVEKQVRSFVRFPGRDNTYIDLNFTDFEDYLNSLNEDSWRSARMTLNRARRWKIRTVFTNEISKWKEVTYRLQKYTCEQHNDYRMHLTHQFYDSLEKNLKENAELLLCFKDDIPLAFGLSLNSSSIANYRYPGVDPEYRNYQAYFLLYYEAIKRAIEKRQKRIYFGPTTYEFKEKIGCKRAEIFGLAKMKNPVLNLVLKVYITFSASWGKKF